MAGGNFGGAGLGMLALGAGVGWFSTTPTVGLDFQGGATAVVRRADGGTMDPDRISRISRVADRLGIPDVSVHPRGDDVLVEIASATEHDLAPLLALRTSLPFAAWAELIGGRTLQSAADGPVQVGPAPVLTAADLARVRPAEEGAIRLELTPEAREGFAVWTAGHVGERVVLTLGDQVLVAPVVGEPITEGVFLIALPGAGPEEGAVLADQLAAAGEPLQVAVQVIGSIWPSWLGLPALRGLAVVTLLAVGAGLATGRRALFGAGAGLLGVGLGIGWYAWSGGTLTMASWVGGAVGLLGGAVVLAAPPQRSAKARAFAAWPAWAAVGGSFGLAVAGSVLAHGFWRGAAYAALPSAIAAAAAGLLGLLACAEAHVPADSAHEPSNSAPREPSDSEPSDSEPSDSEPSDSEPSDSALASAHERVRKGAR